MVQPGKWKAEDAENNDASAYGGGVIIRTAFTAAALNSTHINSRPDSPPLFDDVEFGYLGGGANANRPWQFQYVEQGGYAGLLPYELQPQIPAAQPWE
jgi:hypothetical protein